jgi:hypothetical protein
LPQIRGAVKSAQLVTIQYHGNLEIDAFTEAASRIIRLGALKY